MAEASRHSVLSPSLSLLSPTEQNVSCVLTAKNNCLKTEWQGSQTISHLTARRSLSESGFTPTTAWTDGIAAIPISSVTSLSMYRLSTVPRRTSNVRMSASLWQSRSTVAFLSWPGAAHRQQKESYGELSLTYVRFLRTPFKSASVRHVFFHKCQDTKRK